MKGQNHFAMTVDVDGWSTLLGFYSVQHSPSEIDAKVNIANGITKLLRLFKTHKIPATFFVTGNMAQRHRLMVKEILRDGHEIACHGLAHKKDECLLDKKRQLKTIKQATEMIEKEAGYRPRGFRAPCLRSNEATIEVLEELGYMYDSSVIPSLVPGYYGNLMSPLNPYHPSRHNMTKLGSYRIIEIPVSVNPILRVPLSAAWMRNLGSLWVKIGVQLNFGMGNPAIFYVHPRDVMQLPKTKGVPWHLYRNTGNHTLEMLENIIKFVKRHGMFIQLIDFAQIAANRPN